MHDLLLMCCFADTRRVEQINSGGRRESRRIHHIFGFAKYGMAMAFKEFLCTK